MKENIFETIATKFSLQPTELKEMAEKMVNIFKLPRFILGVLMVAQMLDAGGAKKWLESFQPDSIMIQDYKEAVLTAFDIAEKEG